MNTKSSKQAWQLLNTFGCSMFIQRDIQSVVSHCTAASLQLPQPRKLSKLTTGVSVCGGRGTGVVMESTVLSLGKSVLSGALGYAQSAVAEEVALQLGIQRDHAFIRDELEMMQSFLMAADEERDEHRVVKTWVKQVRDLAYDVEDCLQDFAVRVRKPSWWCKCSPSMLLERRRVAQKMKELRAKVEDVSQRSVRYRLIDGSGSKAATEAMQSTITGATIMSEAEETRRQQDKAKMDLLRLINTNDKDLRVIAVWGTSGVLEDTSNIVTRAYDDLRMNKKFECCAFIKLMNPFNRREFLQSIIWQFYVSSLQQSAEAKQQVAGLVDQIPHKMGKTEEDALVNALKGYVNDKRFLIIVVTDQSTIEEWDNIKKCFPSNKTRSRIVVCTEHVEVAWLCVRQDGTPPKDKKLSDDRTLYAFYEPSSFPFNQGSQNGTHSMGHSSSSHPSTTSSNNPIDGTKLTRIATMVATLEESQLIGRVNEKSDIIKLIMNQASQQPHVVSVWGMGGLGKTTLVQDIYRSPEISRIFDKRACVTVMRPFNCGKLVKSLAKQFGDENKTSLTELLGGQRCLVVLDDLWDTKEWDGIIPHLPKTAGSCIIVTTREENIAKHCSEERNIYKLSGLNHDQARDLFTTKVFKEKTNLDEQYPELVEQANLILKKCDGLPLAIVTIGGFLASQPKTVLAWRKLNEHISADLEMDPKLKMIKAVLVRSFDGLPYHLKSCFLYMSIFPEDYKVSRKRLMQRWTAEGYTREVRGKPAKETAHDIFKELISRSVILLALGSIRAERGIIDSCQLHDLMREISITKSMEENLVFRLEEGCSSKSQGTTRHLAISGNWKGDKREFESMVDLSCVRSLTVFGEWKPFYISKKMRMLRVLDLEDTEGLVDHHLEHIGKLVHLKYLSLNGCEEIFQLPESLGELRQLETLDIRDTNVIILPKSIVKLQKLHYLHAGSTNTDVEYTPLGLAIKCAALSIGVPLFLICATCFVPAILERDGLNMHYVCNFACCILPHVVTMNLNDHKGFPVLPRGSRKLKGLHTLRHVHLAWGNTVIQEIERLTQLRNLGVVGINKKNGPAFCSAISKLSHLESLSVGAGGEAGLRGCLDDGTSSLTLPPPENLQSLKLQGELGELPQWIGKLQNLVKLRLEHTKLENPDAAIKVLGALPSLAILHLLEDSFKCGEAGIRLNFCPENKMFPSLRILLVSYIPGPKSVNFETGVLQFGFSDAGFFSGLDLLPSLKEFMLEDRWYHDGFLKDLQNQLDKNPNQPILKRY